MASDRQQFASALAKWQELGDKAEVSVPVQLGRTAIITSSFTDNEPGTDAGAAELASFRTEAIALGDRLSSMGDTPELAIGATRHDITRLIADPTIVSLYVIGNGSLSTLLLGMRDSYDWAEVAAATTHRKLGRFVQRQCGGLTRNLNVPLGLFAVNDPAHVYAALGDEFNPRDLDDPENDKIRSILDSRLPHYKTFKHLRGFTAVGQPQAVAAGRRWAPEWPACGTGTPPSSPSGTGPRLYRQNFVRRFIDVHAVIAAEASEDQIRYVRMVKERFGFDLLSFYAQHLSLCDAIIRAIQPLAAHDCPGWSAVGLPRLEAVGEIAPRAKPFNLASRGDIDDTIVNVSAIDELLARAYKLIEQDTLNAPFLTK